MVVSVNRYYWPIIDTFKLHVFSLLGGKYISRQILLTIFYLVLSILLMRARFESIHPAVAKIDWPIIDILLYVGS